MQTVPVLVEERPVELPEELEATGGCTWPPLAEIEQLPKLQPSKQSNRVDQVVSEVDQEAEVVGEVYKNQAQLQKDFCSW